MTVVTGGCFITFEGGEGAGKSTQARRLAERLRAVGRTVTLTREPGGSPGAEAIRALLVSGDADRWSPISETLLMYAARRDHIERTIVPALERGEVVICDRFLDSTRAYQGAGGGAPRELIAALEQAVVGAVMPDLTIVFDLPVDAGLSRAAARGEGEARFESKGRDFHERLRAAFQAIAAAEPERCKTINADGDSPPSRPASGPWSRRNWRSRLVADTVEIPHPRDVFTFEQGEAVEEAFLGAMSRGRLHHAWLLTGPEGVGKATSPTGPRAG